MTVYIGNQCTRTVLAGRITANMAHDLMRIAHADPLFTRNDNGSTVRYNSAANGLDAKAVQPGIRHDL